MINIGMLFGRWRVLHEAGLKNYSRYWLCQCDCLCIREVRGEHLSRGRSRSCGCLSTDLSPHGHCRASIGKSPEYNIWNNIKKRCYNPRNPSYPRYGGRGIQMCEQWRSFITFLAEVGARPSAGLSLERIDNNGHYEPGNIRWATPTEQSRNRRSNVRLTFHGQTKTLVEWAEIRGIRPTIIQGRLRRGASLEEALA